MIKKRSRLGLSTSKKSFHEHWTTILENSHKKYNRMIDYQNMNPFDTYFDNVLSQNELLIESDKIIDDKINFCNYTELPSNLKNKFSIYECFHGILFYVYFYSQNKFNTGEIEIHFSGAKNLIRERRQFNILDIFDYENISTEIEIQQSINAYFGITFKNIKINPKAYSIRSGIFYATKSHLISFSFEGYDEENQKWDVLDERNNINDLIGSGGFSLFYVRSTTKCYSSFKIQQTAPGSNDTWGFTLSAFDIHGIVYYREVLTSSDETSYDEDMNSEINFFGIDPCLDMTEHIF